jgi:FkbM family methyltransferase
MPHKMSRLTDTDRERFRHLRKLGLELSHFFDVGASTGRWSSRVAQDFPHGRFNLFEPLIDYSTDYRSKMETTLARHPGFRLHKVALGEECRRATMFLYPGNLVGSTALPLGAKPPDAERIEVDMVTIDYVIEEFRLPLPQVIKMDTQGCELSILQGGTRTLPQVDVLLLECWLTRAYGPTTPLLLEVAEWLREFDFHLWDLGNAWRDPAGVLVAQDCLFLNARTKVSRLRDEIREQPADLLATDLAPELLFTRMRNLLCGRG